VRLAWLWVLLPIGFQVINGCVAPAPNEPINLRIDVLSTRMQEGHCFVGIQNASLTCHVLEVRLHNNSTRGLWQMASQWRATDGLGQNWTAPIASEETYLGAGQQRTLYLGFSVPQGLRLQRLEWTGYGQTISQPLPGA